jgi:Flp pilus assembly protein TadB
MNTIPQDQLAQKQLDRLAAQRQFYLEAKRLQAWHIILSVPCVIVLSLLVAWFPSLKVYAAFWGVTTTLLDVFLFTPWQRSLKQQAARIQEQFDCDVLRLSWSEFRVDRRPDAELVAEYASKFRHRDPEFSRLKHWYPVEVGKLPIHLARIVCQRVNCWWDAKLRRRYATYLIAAVGTLALVVFLIGLIGGLTLEKFFLAVIAPLMPAFVIGIRQYNEHNETAAALDRLKDHADKLWNEAITGKTSPEELAKDSRALQDAIYDHRRRSPLIFDWIYRHLKQAHEEQMNKGAAALVEEALS